MKGFCESIENFVTNITIKKNSEIAIYHVQNGQYVFCRTMRAMEDFECDLTCCAGFAQCSRWGSIQIRLSNSHADEEVNEGANLYVVDLWNVVEFEGFETVKECYDLLRRKRIARALQRQAQLALKKAA